MSRRAAVLSHAVIVMVAWGIVGLAVYSLWFNIVRDDGGMRWFLVVVLALNGEIATRQTVRLLRGFIQ